MLNLIRSTGYSSLFIQIITTLLDTYVLATTPSNGPLAFLKEILWLEFVVQIIEGTFYIWMLHNFSKIDNITPHRYYDWALSTPVMLFSLCSYFLYIRQPNPESMTAWGILLQGWPIFLLLFLLNATMLFFGYLGERGQLPQKTATLLGFIPFFALFSIIWQVFVESAFSKGLFAFFFFVWFLYGVASLFDYTTKNSAYNVLDLFSKNIINLVLAACLYFQYVPGLGQK